MLSHSQVLALGFLPGITSLALRALVESGASFDEIVSAPRGDLAAMGLRRSALDAIGRIDRLLARAEEECSRAESAGARIVQFWDNEFPSLLRGIYAPPITLYVRGELLDEDGRGIAIVGTRAASIYGRLTAERYAVRFSEAGLAVVSGLARGIDTYAHAAVLRAGGRTIAVVASGLDRIEPAIAAKLAERIAGSSGAVISEYPFGTKALRSYFPQRNRIISGIVAGTVVVESGEKGGAMITAGFALDQGREIFAVPGSITAPGSRGTNLLIRTDRARLTQSPDDVLLALGHAPPSADSRSDARSREELSLFEERIFHALGDEPVHVDDICEATRLASSDVLVHLLALEFKGLVRQMAGKMFLRG
jgi:DNA processing protein